MFFYQRQYEDALKAFARALKIRPHEPLAHRLRGGVLQECRRYEEAIAAYDAYFRRAAKPAAEVYEARGLCKEKLPLPDHAGAITDFSRALEINPNLPRLWVLRGWTQLVTGAAKLALDDFQEALRLDPKNGGAYNGRGYARVKLGQTTKAVADAARALRIEPQTEHTFYKAARIYAQAAARIMANPAKRGPKEQETSARYVARALELLRKDLQRLPANERGPFWRDIVKTDTALDPVRRSPGFAQLAARYSPARTGGPRRNEQEPHP
jgi:tetratricopeptide (TPR) repeat protein